MTAPPPLQLCASAMTPCRPTPTHIRDYLGLHGCLPIEPRCHFWSYHDLWAPAIQGLRGRRIKESNFVRRSTGLHLISYRISPVSHTFRLRISTSSSDHPMTSSPTYRTQLRGSQEEFSIPLARHRLHYRRRSAQPTPEHELRRSLRIGPDPCSRSRSACILS